MYTPLALLINFKLSQAMIQPLHIPSFQLDKICYTAIQLPSASVKEI